MIVQVLVYPEQKSQSVGDRIGEIDIEFHDDDLSRFAAEGALPLPATVDQGYVEHDGAWIWYASYGSGLVVILLHSGLGHGGNWGHQVSALVSCGFRTVVIDSRGHGRSTWDEYPCSYALMASDLPAVMDTLQVEKAALVGWSDGAVIALTLAMRAPDWVAGVFFFACNVDPSGMKAIEPSSLLSRCWGRHKQKYERLSASPEQFGAFAEAVTRMQESEPNYSAEDLAQVSVPVTVVQREHDEFIRREHAEYLSRAIPGAKFVELRGVSHFAPLERPRRFNEALLGFLGTGLA